MRKFLLLLIFTPTIIYACINVMGTSLDGGKTHSGARHYAQKYLKIMEETPYSKLQDIETIKYNPSNLDEYTKAENNTKEFYQEELQAVKLILEGEYPKAIVRLLKISEEYPHRYSTATNLGTAYELNDEVGMAIYWIKEGLRLNPKSHEGSEWLHLLILETKLKMREDTKYFEKNHMIDLPATFTSETSLNILDKSRTIDEIGKAIDYQLLERLLFVKPKDAIVADLFFTLGLIEAHTARLESAIKILDISKMYCFPNQEYIEKINNEYKNKIDTRKRNEVLLNYFYGILFVSIIGYLIYKRKKRVLYVLTFLILIAILLTMTIPILSTAKG